MGYMGEMDTRGMWGTWEGWTVGCLPSISSPDSQSLKSSLLPDIIMAVKLCLI